MITPAEECFITAHAYVPEHLPAYVRAVSGAEPHLLGDYLCFRIQDSLLFNGYPLAVPFDEAALGRAVESAIARFRPRDVVLMAPKIPEGLAGHRPRERDQSYRLDLVGVARDAKLRNMLRRAARDARVESSRDMGEEHRSLIAEFLESHPVSQEMRYIFERIPAYVSAVSSARVFSARDGTGGLVAFDVAEFGARDYAFYQFNFRSRKPHVPGASDLLLDAVIGAARSEGKRYLNLGLGISPGVRRFKEKWGGKPFLPYEYCRYAPGAPRLFDRLLEKL
jgi:hypothetical protein